MMQLSKKQNDAAMDVVEHFEDGKDHKAGIEKLLEFQHDIKNPWPLTHLANITGLKGCKVFKNLMATNNNVTTLPWYVIEEIIAHMLHRAGELPEWTIGIDPHNKETSYVHHNIYPRAMFCLNVGRKISCHILLSRTDHWKDKWETIMKWELQAKVFIDKTMCKII